MKVEYGSFKYKLLVAMMLAGEYPYKSLDLCRESDARKKNSISELKNAGIITTATAYDIKRIRFKMFNKRKGEFADELFDGGAEYKPDIHENGLSRLERKDRIAEIIIMMLEAGINVTPDLKPKPDCEKALEQNASYLPYFITSREAREAITIKEDKGKGARFHGTLVSAGGMYNIYNMGSIKMGWIRPAEKTAIDFNEQYQKRMIPWGNNYAEWYGKSAIILSRNLCYINDFIKGKIDLRGCDNISSRNKVDINDYYEHTFYLPLSRQGQIMLNIMCHRKWHYYLTGLFFEKEDLAQPGIKLSIACDAATRDGYYCLVFMDGDIGRLKRFTEMSISPDDYGKFKIICYDFQKEIVESVAPQGMDIISYPFEDVVNAFYGVYDQFEKKEETGNE